MFKFIRFVFTAVTREASGIWSGIKNKTEDLKEKRRGVIAQTLLVVSIISILCVFVSHFPVISDFVHETLINWIDDLPIFSSWISLLDGTVFNHFSVDTAINAAKTIGAGLAYVIPKSLLEAFICAMVIKIIGEIMDGVRDRALVTLIGVVLGLIISMLIGRIDSVTAQSIVYAVVSIGLLLLGIKIMLMPSFHRSEKSNSHGDVVKKLLELSFGVISVAMMTCYTTVLALVLGRRISRWWVLVAAALYCTALIIQYIVEHPKK